MSRRLPDSHYAELVKSIRPYCTGFAPADGYDLHYQLTPHQKAQVTKYANAIRELGARNNYVFRGRNPKHLKAAQTFGQHPEKRPKIKVAFVPFTPSKNAPEETPKLIFKRDVMEIETTRHIKRFAAFDPVRLTINPDKEVAEAVAALGPSQAYMIANGPYQIAVPLSGALVAAEVKKLMVKYDGVKPLPRAYKGSGDKPKDHDYRDWLNGVIGLQFKQQHGGVKHFLESLAKANKARKIVKKGGFAK